MNAVSEKPDMTMVMRRQATNLSIGLIVQFILGMITNLFVHFPEAGTMSQQWKFAITNGLVIAHIVVGTGLVFGAVGFVVRAARSRERRWTRIAVIGMIAIALAYLGGVTFVPTQQDGFSLLMALAMMAALFTYGWGLAKYAK